MADAFPTFASPLPPCNLPVARCPVSPTDASHRILIVRTIANGDILMGTPLVTALRAAYPNAHITWLVERRERESIDAHPCVDELLLWDTFYWKKMTRRGLYPLWYLRARALRKLLRARHYDILISLQPEDSGWLPGAVGARRSIGIFDTFRDYYGATRTSRRARLYDTAYTYDDLPTHRTDQYLLPLKALALSAPDDPRMSMGYTREDEQAAERFLTENGVKRKYIVVAPRTGWSSRCWPIERWAAFCDVVSCEMGYDVVLVGGAGDHPVLEDVAAQMKAARRPTLAAGAFGFRVLAAITARAALMASGDTGPMHVAGAVGTPYLALFGPTPPLSRAPLRGTGRVLMHPVPCGPCDKKQCPNPPGDTHLLCLRLITVDEASDAAKRLLMV